MSSKIPTELYIEERTVITRRLKKAGTYEFKLGIDSGKFTLFIRDHSVYAIWKIRFSRTRQFCF